MNRRELIQRLLSGGAAITIAPFMIESCSKQSSNTGGSGSTIDLDLTQPANSVLNNDGGSLITQNILVINTGSKNFSAVSSICTHQGCTVAYNSGAGNIQCPCHGSVYTATGSNVSGPAPSPLKSYPVSLNGNILTITL